MVGALQCDGLLAEEQVCARARDPRPRRGWLASGRPEATVAATRPEGERLAVTTVADLLSRESRARLLERVRELAELDGLMKQPGSLAGAPEPMPLHRAAHDTT
jgi:hypothetical protein